MQYALSEQGPITSGMAAIADLSSGRSYVGSNDVERRRDLGVAAAEHDHRENLLLAGGEDGVGGRFRRCRREDELSAEDGADAGADRRLEVALQNDPADPRFEKARQLAQLELAGDDDQRGALMALLEHCGLLENPPLAAVGDDDERGRLRFARDGEAVTPKRGDRAALEDLVRGDHRDGADRRLGLNGFHDSTMRTRPSRSQLAEWLGCPARSCEGARMPWRPQPNG